MATQGLFNILGASPQEVRDAYEKEKRAELENRANQTLLNRVVNIGARSGSMLGSSVGRMLGGRLPAEIQAEKEQAVLKEAQASGASYEDILNRIAQTTTDPRRALLVSQMAEQARQERLVKEAQLAKAQKEKAIDYGKDLNAIAATYINPTTKQSYNSFGELPQNLRKKALEDLNEKNKKKTGSMSSLQQLAAKGLGFTVHDDINDYTEEEANQILAKEQRILLERERAKKPDKGEEAYSIAAAQRRLERDENEIAAAASSPARLEKLNSALTILKNNQANVGFLQQYIQQFDKLRSVFLEDEAAGKRVKSTEYLNALLGSDVFPLIKQLGIGARGLDTPAERKFLLQVMTGDVTLSGGALIELTQQRLKAEERNIKKFNAKLKRGGYSKWENANEKLEPIVIGQPASFNAPSTVSPDAGGEAGVSARPSLSTFQR